MMWVFQGIKLGKWIKRKTSNYRTSSNHFRRFNLSLMSCSPAELISVSIEQFKFRFNQLYLQTVEKSNHLPTGIFIILWWLNLFHYLPFFLCLKADAATAFIILLVDSFSNFDAFDAIFLDVRAILVNPSL